MPRRASLFVFLGLAIALASVTGISAGAEPDSSIRAKRADVAAAQNRLTEIRTEAISAEATYNNALYEMNQLNGQITRTTDDLDAARVHLAVAKKALEERAAQVYKSGNVAFMDVLVGVDDFSEFASRLNLWVRLLERERAEFLEVREARNELAARRDRLEAQRKQRVAAVERAIAQKVRAKEAEAQAEAYLNSLNAELREEIEAAQARATAAAMVQKVPEPKPVEEPEPIPEVQVSQVKQAQVPRADLQSEQAAAERKAAARAAARRAERLAEQRAAEREAARKAAEQAAEQAAAEREAARLARLAAEKAARQEAREEARRRAELAAQRAAERREAERQAKRAARRAAIEEAAAEQAAAEREAARLAAKRRAERRAERQAEERAAASASASAAAAEKAAAEQAAERRAKRQAEASASASAAAEKAAAERRAKKRDSASASASASAPSSQDSSRDGGGATAASSASASASASSSPAPGGGGGVSGSGDDVLAVAQEHLGTPYKLSPPGPCVAFKAEDCSCFTLLVYQEFGIALPDSPGGQMGYGTPVHGAPQPGDLLFWSEDGSGNITHVGIAMGDGTTIHASSDVIGVGEVTITDINYVNGYVGARRLL